MDDRPLRRQRRPDRLGYRRRGGRPVLPGGHRIAAPRLGPGSVAGPGGGPDDVRHVLTLGQAPAVDVADQSSVSSSIRAVSRPSGRCVRPRVTGPWLFSLRPSPTVPSSHRYRVTYSPQLSRCVSTSVGRVMSPPSP